MKLRRILENVEAASGFTSEEKGEEDGADGLLIVFHTSSTALIVMNRTPFSINFYVLVLRIRI